MRRKKRCCWCPEFFSKSTFGRQAKVLWPSPVCNKKQKGVSLVSIIKLLGHKRIEMSPRYAQVTPSHLRNKYLKAIAVIENQTDLQKETNKAPGEYPVSEIINHMMTCLNHATQLPTTQKKNILRRLSRIKNDLDGCSFTHLFKMTSQPDPV